MSNHDGHNKNRKLLQRKSRFPLIVELIQAFDLSHYLVREVKNRLQISKNCLTIYINKYSHSDS